MIISPRKAAKTCLRGFRALVICCAVLALAQAVPSLRASTPAPPEVRALWVTRSSLVSPTAISAMIRSASASGFNTLLVQVRGRGDAYYSSPYEPRAELLARQPASFDPLATTIGLAQERGLRVHAWVNVNLVSSGADLPVPRTHVIYRHPEWLMVPRELAFGLARVDARSPGFLGRLARWTRSNSSGVEGLYLSPIHQGAIEYHVGLLDQLAAMYPLDGIHLDYVRYPGPAFDYSRSALAEFRSYLESELSTAERRRFSRTEMAGLVGLADAYPGRWADFRRSRLNTFVMRARTAVKQRRPDLLFSAAVYPDSTEAATQRLQDWRTWLENRIIDVVCPMAYTPDSTVFASQIASVRQVAAGQPVWAGIGAYRLSSTQTIENIRTARRLGADGIVLFSYDSLTRPPHGNEYLSSVGRAAFTP